MAYPLFLEAAAGRVPELPVLEGFCRPNICVGSSTDCLEHVRTSNAYPPQLWELVGKLERESRERMKEGAGGEETEREKEREHTTQPRDEKRRISNQEAADHPFFLRRRSGTSKRFWLLPFGLRNLFHRTFGPARHATHRVYNTHRMGLCATFHA